MSSVAEGSGRKQMCVGFIDTWRSLTTGDNHLLSYTGGAVMALGKGMREVRADNTFKYLMVKRRIKKEVASQEKE